MFIDDVMTTVIKQDNIPLQVTVDNTPEALENYMKSKRLAVNREKTQLLVLNRENILKSNIYIAAEPENVHPKHTIKFLGVTLSEKLDFKPFLTEGMFNLFVQLKTRVSVLKKSAV